jgi:hypothetical protein
MAIQTYTAGTSVGNAYVSSGNTAVTFMSICNFSALEVTANVYVVPSTASFSPNNIVFQNLSLTPGETYQIYGGQERLILGPSDSIQINASAGAAVTTVTSYAQI